MKTAIATAEHLELDSVLRCTGYTIPSATQGHYMVPSQSLLFLEEGKARYTHSSCKLTATFSWSSAIKFYFSPFHGFWTQVALRAQTRFRRVGGLSVVSSHGNRQLKVYSGKSVAITTHTNQLNQSPQIIVVHSVLHCRWGLLYLRSLYDLELCFLIGWQSREDGWMIWYISNTICVSSVRNSWLCLHKQSIEQRNLLYLTTYLCPKLYLRYI